MTEMGRRVGTGDMLKSVYDSDEDGVIAVAQTEADMVKGIYDPVIAVIQALLADHKTRHQSGGTDEIDVTDLTGTTPNALIASPPAGKVIRLATFYVSDGTNAGTIKCQQFSIWNADAIAEVDNIGKGATVGVFSLSADGQKLVVDAAGFSGNIKFCILDIYKCSAQTVPSIYPEKYGNSIRYHFYDHDTGAGIDISAEIGTGELRCVLAYITG